MESKEELKKKGTIEIKAKWDTWNTTLLTSKLYRHVKKGEIEFELQAKKGSIITNFLVKLVYDIGITFFPDLTKYIWKRIRKQRDKGKQLPPVTVINYIDNRTIIITGSDEDELPHKFYTTHEYKPKRIGKNERRKMD